MIFPAMKDRAINITIKAARHIVIISKIIGSPPRYVFLYKLYHADAKNPKFLLYITNIYCYTANNIDRGAGIMSNCSDC
jgi:hypothetical protein